MRLRVKRILESRVSMPPRLLFVPVSSHAYDEQTRIERGRKTRKPLCVVICDLYILFLSNEILC